MESNQRTEAVKKNLFKIYRKGQINGKDGYSFEGTGVLLCGAHLLTCAHVVQNESSRLLKSDDDEYQELKLIALCGDLDAALLKLPDYFASSSIQSIPLASGVPWSNNQFPSNNCSLYGGIHSKPTTGISLQTVAEDDGMGLQFDGAAVGGYSGGPLLLTEFPDIAVFGIGGLGGKNSPQMRATSSDLLIKWLNKVKQDKTLNGLDVKTISFEDVLKKVAFGDSDRSSAVQEQWFSNWAYARNPAGEYVSAETKGERPLMKNGIAIKVFDSTTEHDIRSLGINTGSTHYAELYEKFPQRFGNGIEDGPHSQD
jgi:hypothetical protein